jgi:hypothetical protein
LTAALRFQEQSIAMQLEEAHAAGESMLSAAAIPLEEQPDSIAAMQLDTLQYDLAEATNRVLECAQVVLEDPDDEDAVEQFTASLRRVQDTIVAVRRVLAPWEYEEDGGKAHRRRVSGPVSRHGGRHSQGEAARQVAATDHRVVSDDAVGGDDDENGGERARRHGEHEAAGRAARRRQGRRAAAQGRAAHRGGARVDARAVGGRAADARS